MFEVKRHSLFLKPGRQKKFFFSAAYGGYRLGTSDKVLSSAFKRYLQKITVRETFFLFREPSPIPRFFRTRLGLASGFRYFYQIPFSQTFTGKNRLGACRISDMSLFTGTSSGDGKKVKMLKAEHFFPGPLFAYLGNSSDEIVLKVPYPFLKNYLFVFSKKYQPYPHVGISELNRLLEIMVQRYMSLKIKPDYLRSRILLAEFYETLRTKGFDVKENSDQLSAFMYLPFEKSLVSHTENIYGDLKIFRRFAVRWSAEGVYFMFTPSVAPTHLDGALKAFLKMI